MARSKPPASPRTPRILLAKTSLFHRHLRATRFQTRQIIAFWLLRPVLDVACAYGFIRGLWLVAAARWHSAPAT